MSISSAPIRACANSLIIFPTINCAHCHAVGTTTRRSTPLTKQPLKQRVHPPSFWPRPSRDGRWVPPSKAAMQRTQSRNSATIRSLSSVTACNSPIRFPMRLSMPTLHRFIGHRPIRPKRSTSRNVVLNSADLSPAVRWKSDVHSLSPTQRSSKSSPRVLEPKRCPPPWHSLAYFAVSVAPKNSALELCPSSPTKRAHSEWKFCSANSGSTRHKVSFTNPSITNFLFPMSNQKAGNSSKRE
ncbi:unannotated protein [freshwater metagenome]|uniref:Unannotated protein n=1 Tax=freshwater metagenome TaxID=449393 RepID=A0A6J6G122_9ZZZZ